MEARVSAAPVAPPLIPAPKTFLKRLSSLRLSSSRSSYKLTHSPPLPSPVSTPPASSPLPPPASSPLPPPASSPLPPPASSALPPPASSPLPPPASFPLPPPASSPLPAPASSPLPPPATSSVSPPANHARAPPAAPPAATHPNTPPAAPPAATPPHNPPAAPPAATPPHNTPAAPPLPLPAAPQLSKLASPPPAAHPFPPPTTPPLPPPAAPPLPPPTTPPLPPPAAPPLPPPTTPPLPPRTTPPLPPPTTPPPPSKSPRDPKGEDNRTYSTSTSEVMGYLDEAIGDHPFSTSSVDDARDYLDFSPTVKFHPPPNSTPPSSNPPTTTIDDSWTANGVDVEDVFHSDQAHFASEHNPDTHLSRGHLLTNAATENMDIDNPETAILRNSHNDHSEENNNELFDTETRNLSPLSKNQGRRRSSGSPLKVTVSKLKPDIKTVRQQIRPGSVGELTHMFTNLMDEQVLSPSVADHFQFDVGETAQSHGVREMTPSHGVREMTPSHGFREMTPNHGVREMTPSHGVGEMTPSHNALPSDPYESLSSPTQRKSSDSVSQETSPQLQSSRANPSSSMYQQLITHPLKQAQDLTQPLEHPPQNITHPLNQPQNTTHPLNQPQNMTHPLKQSQLKSTSLPVLDATPGLDYLAASREMFQLVISSINRSQTNLAHSDSKLSAVPAHARASENKPPSLIATSRGSNTSSRASLVKRGSKLHSEMADKTENEMADNFTRDGTSRNISTTDRGGTLDGRDEGLLIASTPNKDDSQHTFPTDARTPVGRNVAGLQYLNKDDHRSPRQPGQEREFSFDVSRSPANVEELVARFASSTDLAAPTQSPPGHDNNTTYHEGERSIDKEETTGSNGEWTSLHSRPQAARHAEPLHILSNSENKNRSTQLNERRHSSHIIEEDAPLDTPQTAQTSPQLSFTANRGLDNSQLCVSSSQISDLPGDNNFQGTEHKTSSSWHDNQIQLADHPRDYAVMSDGRTDVRTSLSVAEDYSCFPEEKGFVKNAVAKYSSQVIGHVKNDANGGAVHCVDDDSLANSDGGGRRKHSVDRKEIGFESSEALGHLKDEALLPSENETNEEKSIARNKQIYEDRNLRDVVVIKSQRGQQSADVPRLRDDEDGDDVLNSIDQSDAASEASISSEFQAAVALLSTEDPTDSCPGQGQLLDRPSSTEQQHDDFRTLLDDIQIETDITSGFLRSSRRSGRKQRLTGSNSDPEHTRVSAPGHSVVPGLKGSTLGTTLYKTTTKGQTTTAHIGVPQSVDLSEEIRQPHKGVDLSEVIQQQHKGVSPTLSEPPAEEKPLHADSRAASSPTRLHINGADNSSLTKETFFDSHFFIQPENMAAANHQVSLTQDLILATETSRSIPWSDYERRSQFQFTAAPPEMETERSVNLDALSSLPKTATKEVPNKTGDQQNRHAAPGNQRDIQTTTTEREEQRQLSSQESSIVATLVSRSIPWAMYEEKLSPSKEGPILSEEFVGDTVHEGARRNSYVLEGTRRHSSVDGNHLETNTTRQYDNDEDRNLETTPAASFVDSNNEEKSMAEQKEDNSHLFSKEKFQDMRRVFEKQYLKIGKMAAANHQVQLTLAALNVPTERSQAAPSPKHDDIPQKEFPPIPPESNGHVQLENVLGRQTLLNARSLLVGDSREFRTHGPSSSGELCDESVATGPSDLIVATQSPRSIPWSDYERRSQLQFTAAPPEMETERSVTLDTLSISPKTATKEIPNKTRDQQNRHAAPGNQWGNQTTATEREEQQQLSSQESSIVATLVSRSIPWAMYEERLSPSKEGPILLEEFVGDTDHEGARRSSSVDGHHLETNTTSQYDNDEDINLEITPAASFVDSNNEEKSMAEQKEDNSHLFSKEKFQDMRRVFEKQERENHFQTTQSSQVEKDSSRTSPSSLVGVSKPEDYSEVSIHEGRNVASRLETGEGTSRDAHNGCVHLKRWPNRDTEIAKAEDGECRDSSGDSTSGSDVDTSGFKRPRRRKSKQTNLSYDLQTGQLQPRSVSPSSSIASSHSAKGDIIQPASVDPVGSSDGNSWLGTEEFVNSQGKHHTSLFIRNSSVIVDGDLGHFGETSTHASKSAVTQSEDIRKHINSGESLQSGVETRPPGASLSEVGINRSEDEDRPGSFVEDKATAHAQKHSARQANSNSQSSGKSRLSDSGFNIEDIISLGPGKEHSQRVDTGVHRQISDVDVQDGLRGRRPSTDSHKQDQLIDAFLRSGARPTVSGSSRETLVQEDTAWVSNRNDNLDQKGFQQVQQPTSSETQDESTPSELVTSSTKIDKHLFRNTDSESIGPSFWRSASNNSSNSSNSSNDNMTAVVGELSSFSIHRKVNSVDESFKDEHGDSRISASSRGTAPAGHDQSVDSDIYLVQDTKGDYYALQEVDDTRSSVGKVNLHVFDAPPEEQIYGPQNGHATYDERVPNNYNDIHAINTDLYVDSSAVEEDKAREVISAYLNMQEISGRPESVVSNGTSHTLHKPAHPQRNHVVVQRQGYESMTHDTSVQTDDETSPDSLRHAPSYHYDGRAHRPPGTAYPGTESGYNDFRADRGQDRHTSSLRLTDRHPDPAKVTRRPHDYSTGQAHHPTDSANHSRHHTVVSPFLMSPIAITTTTQAVVGEQVGMHIDYSTADASTSDEDSSQRLYVVKNLPHKSSLKKSSKYDSSSLSDSGSDIVFTKGGSPGARISHNNTSDNILRSYNSSHRQQRYASRSDSLSPRAVVDGPVYSTYHPPRSHQVTSISPRDDRSFHNHNRQEKLLTSARQPEENSLYRVRNLSASMPDGLHHAGTRRKVSRNSNSHLNEAATLDRSPRKHHSPERFFKNPQFSLTKGENEASRHSSGEDNQYRSVTKVYLSDNELKSAPRSSHTPHNEPYSHRTSDEATITRTQSVQPSRLSNDPPSTKSHRTVIQLDVDGTTARDPQSQLNYSAGDRQMTTTGRPRHSDRHGIRSSGDDSDSDPGRPDARDSRMVRTLKQKDGNKLYVVSSTVSDPQASNGNLAHSPGWYKSTIDINMNSLEKLQPVLSDLLNQERADSSSYRTDKTVLLVKETSPQTNVGRSVQRTHSTDFVYPDSGQGTEITSSDGEHELRHKTERVERIYEMRSEPEIPEHLSSMEDLNNDLRVLRGNILIKNRLTGEHDLDDFDENVNLFDHSFHLGKDNPLFSSDQDLQASLRNEEERDLARHVTQDITFESVDKIAHQFSSEKQVQVKSTTQRKKQNLSQLLLSKLANVDSKDIRQTIDVEHHNEEIYGDIDFIHADGQRKGSKNTRNFDSVNENVELTLTQGKAYVIIKVIAERIIPTDYEFNVWRKSQAIVTREIEIDLLANDQRRRLYKHVMSSAGVAGSLQYNSRGQDSEQLSPQERQLSSIETLKLFSQILDVTDGQGDKDVTETRTRQEMGQLPASAMDLLY